MKRKVLLSGAVGVSILALAIGLGVGLTNNKDDAVDNDQGDDLPENEAEPWKNFRLPKNIVPTNYNITLRPDVENDISNGFEIIKVTVLKPTKFVIIHAIEGDFTNIEEFTVYQAGSVAKQTRSFYHNDEAKQQYYVVELEEELKATEAAELHIRWTGKLVGTLVGINKVTYWDDGMEKYIIATKFEPTYAREAFPCFDEPALKATYDLVMYHEKSHRGLWNMPVVEEDCNCKDCNNKFCRTQFMQSPKMGTYQPTFIVHNMTYEEEIYTRSKGPNAGTSIPLRVYTPYDKKEQGHHAMEVQYFVMDHYETEFGIDYPLPKLDLIAIPDFVTGAMEQWGLITYRETSLLFDENEGSTSSKQSTSATIAHEMVHQWFGNLVTMEFWDNIWLNEGFATYYKYGAIEAAFEEPWDTENQQIYSDIIYSLNRDVTPSSRPIIADVRNPDEITAAFDWVIYQKGSSVIYMVQEALGHDSYQRAIKSYLEEYAYRDATEEDLLREFQKVIDAEKITIDGKSLDATELWMPFLRQPLYPLLEVTKSGSKLTVAQTRNDKGECVPFLHSPDSELGESDFNWEYPMIIYHIDTNGNTGEKMLEAGSQTEISTEGSSTIKLNSRQTGFYRVKYDDSLQKDLINVLNTDLEKFDEMDRVGLMDDAFHLAISGDYTYKQALDFVDYITNDKEDSYYAWNLFSSRTSYMRSMMSGTDTGKKFVDHFKPSIKKQFDKLNRFNVDKENDSHITKRKRATIVSLAVSYEVEEATEEAQTLFETWRKTGTKPHPDVRGPVYNLGVQSGSYEDWEFVYEQYNAELVASEKRTLMRALASTENVTTIDFMLNVMSADKTIVLEQDFFTFINYISGASSIGNKMAFDWARVHWAELVERFTTGDRNFGRMVPNMVDYYNTEYGLWAASDFFKMTEGGAGEGPRATALDKIESNIEWVREYVHVIDEWLADKALER